MAHLNSHESFIPILVASLSVLDQERVRDWRPTWRLNNTDPTASNFYPVTAAIQIQEPDNSALAVLTDRAQGVQFSL